MQSHAATRPGIRSDRFPASASTPKNVTETERAATRGHNPASELVRASDRKKKPIATPESSATPMADERLLRDVGSWGSACAVVCRLTSTIEPMPTAMPATARGAGRSPSRTETTTGMVTPQTAVVGATTAMAPIDSAW